MRASRSGRLLRAAAGVVVLATLVPLASGCSLTSQPVPGCGAIQRLGLVAQSVPTAAYIPCLNPLPPGWRASGFQAASGHSQFSLRSNLAPSQPVQVRLEAACDVAGATATTPRGPGVSTYTKLRTISPRYSGTLIDVFPGGCVTYQFNFQRGPHIGLIENFESAVALFPRQQLAVELHRRLGITLGP
ncbi:MAG TPA: hypothetical protein VLX59_17495 [Acidimicrobiales bacterium]|nr:hypothetical protein [Acidimicrobiales bacterium]